MKDYRVMFLRDTNNHPVGCVAMQLFVDKVYYQLSTLNPNDDFDRRMARHLAIGRLVEAPFTVHVNKSNIHDTVRAVMMHLIGNDALPKRSRLSAKRWVKENLK